MIYFFRRNVYDNKTILDNLINKIKGTKRIIQVYDTTIAIENDKEIKSDNLTFCYKKILKLNKLNLDINQRKTIILIGKSGYGKSTIGNLLNGPDCFPVGHDVNSQTNSISCIYSERLNCFIIDTIGFGDNNGIDNGQISNRLFTFLFINKLSISSIILIDYQSDITKVRMDGDTLHILNCLYKKFDRNIFEKIFLLIRELPMNKNVLDTLNLLNQKISKKGINIDITKVLSFDLTQDFLNDLNRIINHQLTIESYLPNWKTKLCKNCGLKIIAGLNTLPCLHHENKRHVGDKIGYHSGYKLYEHDEIEIISDINIGNILFSSLATIASLYSLNPYAIGASGLSFYSCFQNKEVCKKCKKSTNLIGCKQYYNCCGTNKNCKFKCSKCDMDFDVLSCLNNCSNCDMQREFGCIEDEHLFI